MRMKPHRQRRTIYNLLPTNKNIAIVGGKNAGGKSFMYGWSKAIIILFTFLAPAIPILMVMYNFK